MQANRKRDTGPELRLRRELHSRGLRFRVDLPIPVVGFRAIRPDLAFTRWGVLVFVDGCFWHGCTEHGTSPRTNAGYWSAKIASNRERDIRQTIALEEAGWTVLRIWEHEPACEAADRVCATLTQAARSSSGAGCEASDASTD